MLVQIDNLVKGASGQALQNLNIMLGFPESTGLLQQPMFPWPIFAVKPRDGVRLSCEIIFSKGVKKKKNPFISI